MISRRLARDLRAEGLVWTPRPGDAFSLLVDEAEEFSGIETDSASAGVYTVSEMTVESHHYPTGTVLGFNGTTEWALDSVSLEEALWLPREHQLRALLGPAFRSLRRVGDPDPDAREHFAVDTVLQGRSREHVAADPADAYAEALLALIRDSR